MSWSRFNKTRADYSTFDTEEKYTARELEAYADALLREDAKVNEDWKDTGILFEEHLYSRRRREIMTSSSGVVDQTITNSLSRDGQMMYNRTHPEGRKVNSEQQRKKNGASYYR